MSKPDLPSLIRSKIACHFPMMLRKTISSSFWMTSQRGISDLRSFSTTKVRWLSICHRWIKVVLDSTRIKCPWVVHPHSLSPNRAAPPEDPPTAAFPRPAKSPRDKTIRRRKRRWGRLEPSKKDHHSKRTISSTCLKKKLKSQTKKRSKLKMSWMLSCILDRLSCLRRSTD